MRLLQISSLEKVDKGDVVRLCRLLKDLGDRWGYHSKKTDWHEEVNLVLDEVLPGAQHRRDSVHGAMQQYGGMNQSVMLPPNAGPSPTLRTVT